jgi:CRISPR-associated endonuclease Csn1
MWEEKVERLSKNVTFWKNKAKRAQTESYRNTCTRQKLLWQMELDYWRSKLDRFKMKTSDLTDGFRNSQLVDTGIITKYALLYLKTLFKSVEVQNGQSTSAFRKIFGIPEKVRSTHYHHAVDAAILTLIPASAQRSRMLKLFYEIDEMKRGGHEYSGLQFQLNKEIENCGMGKGVATVDQYIEDHVLVNYYKQDRTLQDANNIRGKLHAETFLGAITQWNGEEKKYVKREELKYKKSSRDPGFKSWEDLESAIVNKQLVQMMKSQFPEGTTFQEACEQDIYMLNKRGEKVNRIRHIRIEVKEKHPLAIKKHTNLSAKDYKQYYYAGMGDLYVICEYQNQHEREFIVYSLFSIAENRKMGVEDIPATIIGKKGIRLTLGRIIKKGDMILIYKDSPEELYDLDTNLLSKRLYMVCNPESDGRLNLCHHLCAKQVKGQSIKDYDHLPQNIRCGAKTIKFLQMGKDFSIVKGRIEFK